MNFQIKTLLWILPHSRSMHAQLPTCLPLDKWAYIPTALQQLCSSTLQHPIWLPPLSFIMQSVKIRCCRAFKAHRQPTDVLDVYLVMLYIYSRILYIIYNKYAFSSGFCQKSKYINNILYKASNIQLRIYYM